MMAGYVPTPSAIAAAVSRASADDYGGVEILAPPGWPHASNEQSRSQSKDQDENASAFPPPQRSKTHIAVLDASFNPPTIAHLALASSEFPPPLRLPFPRPDAPGVTQPANPANPATPIAPDADPGPYTARLLLYSCRNADKTPRASDAGTRERADMMLATAGYVGAGVGLIHQPTFVGKAEVLVRSLRSGAAAGAGEGEGVDEGEGEGGSKANAQDRVGAGAAQPVSPPGTDTDNNHPPSLTFLVGADTLVRIFDPKYYADMDAALTLLFTHAWLVCARRRVSRVATEPNDAANTANVANAAKASPNNGAVETNSGTDPLDAEFDALLAGPAAGWVARGRVRVVEIGDLGGVSSTVVRAAAHTGDEAVVREKCPAGVADYVLQHGLYR